MRTQDSVRKGHSRSATGRKSPGRCDPNGARETGDGVVERIAGGNLDCEWNTCGLCRDIAPGRGFDEEIVERPRRYSLRSRICRRKRARGYPDYTGPDLMPCEHSALMIRRGDEIA